MQLGVPTLFFDKDIWELLLVLVQVLLGLLEDIANPNSPALPALLDVPTLVLWSNRLATLSHGVQCTFKTSFFLFETTCVLHPLKEEELGTSSLISNPNWTSDAEVLLLLLVVGIPNSITLSSYRIPREHEVPGCIAWEVKLAGVGIYLVLLNYF